MTWSSDSPQTASRWRIAAILLIVGAGALSYFNAVNNYFIGVDTVQAVRDNPDIRSLSPLWRAMSLNRLGEAAANDNSTLVRRPLLSLSFALNHAALGPEAWGFQLGNVAIHLITALLLFGVIRRTALACDWTAEHACIFAAACASLWVAHPLTTESVTNIVQRAESLMGLWALLTFYAAIRDRETPRFLWRALAVCSCCFGMLTKEGMVAVPPLLWLHDAVFLSRGWLEPWQRRRGFYLAIGASLSIPLILVALTAENSARDFDPARVLPYQLSQARVILHYLRLSLWPDRLYHYILGEPFFFHFQDGLGSIALPLIAIAGLCVAVAWGCWQRHPLGFLGAALLLPLLPTSLTATFTVIQEHRMYLSLMPVIVAGGIAIDQLRLKLGRRSLPAVALLFVLVLTGLACRTHRRNLDYRSNARLWAPEDLPLAYRMMVGLAIHNGRNDEAAELIGEALGVAQAEPDGALARERRETETALATVRALQHRLDESERILRQIVEEHPDEALARNNLGVVLFLRGDHDAARDQIAAALRLRPQMVAANFNMALIALAAGDATTGAEHLRRARELLPPAARMEASAESALISADFARVQFSVERTLPEEAYQGEVFSIEFPLLLAIAGGHPPSGDEGKPD